MSAAEIIRQMPARYRKGQVQGEKTFYFSIEDDKFTVVVTPDSCTVEPGKTRDQADVVLKTTQKIFENLVRKGKAPGPIDIARGKFKTNDVQGLTQLQQLFDLK